MTFPGSIQKDRGEPGKVRIGTVAGGEIFLQETALIDVGTLGSYTPVDGDNVALLGQSAVGSSAGSWLALGRVESLSGLTGRTLVHSSYYQAPLAFFFQGVVADIGGLAAFITLPAGEYVVVVQTTIDMLQGTAGPTAVAECVIDGVVQTAQLLFSSAAGGRSSANQQWQTTYITSGGTLDVHMTARRAGGADNQISGQAMHSTMLVQIFR